MPTRSRHAQLPQLPEGYRFLDGLRSDAVFVPLRRARGHHSVDSLNIKMSRGLKAKAGVGQCAASKHAPKAFVDSLRDEVKK